MKALQAMLLLIAFSLAFCFPHRCLAEAKDRSLYTASYAMDVNPASLKRRVVQFPRDYSLGEFVIKPYGKGLQVRHAVGAARGTIVVPPGCLALFIPTHRFYADPAVIKTISPESIDLLEMTASSVADDEDGLCDRALSYIGHLKNILDLNLDRSDTTDKGLALASALPKLQKIAAAMTLIEGKCFEKLAACKTLHCIDLNCCPLKNENLKYLPGIPNLQYLLINRCNVTDEGIKNMAGCKQLLALDMGNNGKVTDKSIPYLLTLKNLRFLRVNGTAITLDGMKKLKPLPLVQLTITPGPLAKTQMKLLERAMPGVHFATGQGTAELDPDSKVILSPLH